jgi:hypothetical protein
MTHPKTKLSLVEDADATGDVAKAYDEWRAFDILDGPINILQSLVPHPIHEEAVANLDRH